ncbi:hypothetical protein AVEN_271492-1 [Araneus ventricosus]|uniref:Uncharacterized protein n=1 Tax=Araneus ventricosus TaxID=182803 RepID=A0A4Y2U6T2_ARAVE|nr:hypothetical protein AVEN_271492-1 [Araneus ventricosus]
MDELVDDSRIVAPFLPSLSHISTVKVALSLFNEFGGVNSNITLREIQTGNTAASIVCFEEKGERKFKTTKKNLAFIPELLRKKVLEAAEGLIHTVRYWKVCNATFFNLKRGEFVIHWRSDGTIDTVKTVQQLVLDESINIRKRFEIACKYGLERNIRILWAEMQPSDQTENFDTAYNYLEQFWVRWMRHGSRVPWMQEASEYFKHARGYFSTGFTRFSWFFSYLQPGDRQKFLKEMEFAEDDDLRLCLHAMTKEEEEKILKANVALVLLNCLRWPLQNLFLETVQKTWKYIDESKFKAGLPYLVPGTKNRKIIKKSPLKYDILQNYAKEEFGCENIVCLDTKTRWNILRTTSERFLEIKSPISKALTDIEEKQILASAEFETLTPIVAGLKPGKISLEKL